LDTCCWNNITKVEVEFTQELWEVMKKNEEDSECATIKKANSIVEACGLEEG
jgi:hypothetical protein